MKRVKLVGLTVAAFAVMGVAASSAFAAAPEFGRCVSQANGKFSDAGCTKEVASKGKFEWLPGPGPKPGFHSHMAVGSATLETVGGTKITCTAEESPGVFKNAKEVGGVEAKFNGCKTQGLACQNKGTEEIITAPLGGVLGVEKVGATLAANKLAVELKSEKGNIAEFTCAGLPVVVTGSVLHPVTSNKMLIEATEKFSATKGEQKPSAFAGEPDDSHILMSATGSKAPEEAGQTITAVNKGEEKMEANSTQ